MSQLLYFGTDWSLMGEMVQPEVLSALLLTPVLRAATNGARVIVLRLVKNNDVIICTSCLR